MEYGFDVKGAKCGGRPCFDFAKFESTEQMREKYRVLGHRITNSALDHYERAKCHPLVQKHIHPVVQFFWWRLFPFNWFLGYIGDCTTLVCLPFAFIPCIFCELFVVVPWNGFCFVLLFPIVCLMCITFPCLCYCACLIQCFTSGTTH